MKPGQVTGIVGVCALAVAATLACSHRSGNSDRVAGEIDVTLYLGVRQFVEGETPRIDPNSSAGKAMRALGLPLEVESALFFSREGVTRQDLAEGRIRFTDEWEPTFHVVLRDSVQLPEVEFKNGNVRWDAAGKQVIVEDGTMARISGASYAYKDRAWRQVVGETH